MRYVVISRIVLGLVFSALAVVSRAEVPASSPRHNAVTQAVKKTKQGVVCIRVPRPGGKNMIGAGVIVDERGIIVTNCHVVAGRQNVSVCLHDGAKLTGEVLVNDPASDLAIVRIETDQNLTALPLATAKDLMVGENVIAIGHPCGYTNTVTTGIISALNREIEVPTGDMLTGLIQITAPINPGNSGGALLNINGELIGINVAIRDGAQAIAFTINADHVKAFLAKHMSAGKVSGVNHGLKYKERLARETGAPSQVIVTHAATASLKSGDRLVSVAGQNIANTFDVERAFWGKKVGEHVALKIVRDGQPQTVILTLGSSDTAGQVLGIAPISTPAVPTSPALPVSDPR